jgi:hypothetical protein
MVEGGVEIRNMTEKHKLIPKEWMPISLTKVKLYSRLGVPVLVTSVYLSDHFLYVLVPGGSTDMPLNLDYYTETWGLRYVI